jgi:cytochrome P450 family 130
MTEYDPFMPVVIEGDPSALYAELRANTPRLFIERYNAWFFSTFEDVWALEKERTLSVSNGITPTQLLLGAPGNPFMVSQMEPPIHTPFRAALNELVKPSVAQRLEEAMRAEARALLAPIRAQGGGDLLLDYAGPFASKFGCSLSGLPREDSLQLMRWINGFFHRDPENPGDTGIGAQSGMEMIAYITDFLGAVRAGKRTAEGAMAALLALQRDDPSVTDDHVVFMLFNLQIAASDTVPKAVSATFHRLWSNPAERAKLNDKPYSILAAFLEAVRIDMPTQMQGRTATERLAFGDIVIEPGQKTMFMFASANRDAAEFDAPDQYRIDRGNRRTLGFGNGLHRCLGIHIAQVEGKVAIEEAMALIPHYTVDMAASRKHKTEYVKGWSNLVVTVQ